MKSEHEILEDLQKTLITRTDRVNLFQPNSVIGAIFSAVARVMAEVYFRFNRVARGLFTTTATDEALDNLGFERFGLTRLAAAPASVILIFQGDAATVIPAGTQVRASNGFIFETAAALTLGVKNPAIQTARSAIIADSVTATATTPGSAGNVPPHTVTELIIPIAGVDSLDNPLPGVGGSDAESDADFAGRIRAYPGLLAQGTIAFYTAVCQAADGNVLRVNVRRDGFGGVIVDLVHRSMGTFDGTALSAIEQAIRDNRQMEIDVTAGNLVYTDIDVTARVRLKDGFTLDEVHAAVAGRLVEFLNWRLWPLGQNVAVADLMAIVNEAEGVDYLVPSSFEPALTQISVGEASLPRLVGLTLNDAGDLTSKAVPAINQTF